jgi:hypothetical protein
VSIFDVPLVLPIRIGTSGSASVIPSPSGLLSEASAKERRGQGEGERRLSGARVMPALAGRANLRKRTQGEAE